jgi:hypothetical protein
MYGHTGEEKPDGKESKRPDTMPKLVMRGGFLGWLAGEWPAGWLSALRLQIVHRNVYASCGCVGGISRVFRDLDSELDFGVARPGGLSLENNENGESD